ncbi:unnamed protein product [Allacma fusca]|uniref:Man1/Src1-like C-terminal domain-containing protein n=1 Tax=Allacma fusca TaxID=39272 RepID=A0A8J2KZK2_9HEXA|nr:unnamed protein product [Allacma fusca]
MASYEDLSDNELREKLLEVGYDLPVSINREFLIKKLKSVTDSSSKNGSRRKSVGRSTAVDKETDHQHETRQVNSRVKSRLSLSEIGVTGSPKRRNHNFDVSVDTGGSLNSRSRLTYNSRSAGGNDEDLSTPSPAGLSTRSTTSTQGDLSWSKKSSPQEWTRYSSLFPTPLPTAPTPPSAFAPTTTCTPIPSTSTNLNNGNWNNHSAAPSSRLSLASKRNLGSDIHTPSTDRLSSVAGHSADRGHFISRILVAFAVLFFAMIAILYLNLSNNSGKVPGLSGSAIEEPSGAAPSGPPTSTKDDSTLTSNYPICGFDGVGLPCIETPQLKTSRVLFSTLKEELVQRAKWKPCSYNLEDRLPLSVAKSLLLHLSDKKKSEVEECFTSMLILCIENPNWGLRIDREDMTEILNRSDLIKLDYATATISAPNISPNFMCNVVSYIKVFFTYIVLVGAVVFAGFLIYKGVVRYQMKKKDEANEVFVYVETVLQMLQEQYEHSKDSGVDPYLAVSHIRDSMVPAKDRITKAALWNKVVDHISNNESRVREEIQHISGEEFRVWRWLPNASPLISGRSRVSFMTPTASPSITPPSTPQGNAFSTSNSARPPMGTPCPTVSSSKWQGQAFELSDGSPNALPITPTNCLKIRQMFDSDAADEERENRIQRAILDKCPDAGICHIGVEHGSAEGCVYVKCATKEDARKAYLALHGWWFDGHLLSVKFLREERYLVRFPMAKSATTPIIRRY